MSPGERPDEHPDDERGWRRGGAEAQSRHARTVARKWRGPQRGAPSRCRHSQLSPPLFARGSPGAELSGLAHGAARLDVMTCSGFAHIHMRASRTDDLYIDDIS